MRITHDKQTRGKIEIVSLIASVRPAGAKNVAPIRVEVPAAELPVEFRPNESVSLVRTGDVALYHSIEKRDPYAFALESGRLFAKEDGDVGAVLFALAGAITAGRLREFANQCRNLSEHLFDRTEEI